VEIEASSGKATKPKPQVARILNMQSEQLLLDYGKDGFRPMDRVVFVRRTKEGPLLLGTGTVDRVWNKDAQATITAIFVPFGPEEEVYVCNRNSSPLSLIRADLKTQSNEK
jgi:hypothetical protein